MPPSVFFYNMAGLSRKRPIKEVDRLDLLTKPVPNAILHGAITSLSPVKKRRNSHYFDGTLYDGHRQLRMVGFLPAQQKKLDDFCAKKKMVTIKNCEVKASRQCSDQMEIVLKSSTEISASFRELDPSVFNAFEVVPTEITLKEMSSLNNYQKVVVNVKVLTTMESIHVLGGGGNRM